MTLQLKITLQGSTKPPIWRRVLVSDTLNFYQLHVVIQGAFNWQMAHLFRFGKDERDYPGIGIIFEDPMPGEGKALSADKVLLKEFLKQEKQNFSYVYDFGDNWEHKILVEKLLAEDTKHPTCTGGKGFAPPEDCGGIWGYYDMLEALDDPKHEEHETYMEWLGMKDDEYLDKHYFSAQDSNKRIKQFLKQFGDQMPFG